MSHTPAELLKMATVVIPKMTCDCSSCKAHPTPANPVRLIYPPGTIFHRSRRERIRNRYLKNVGDLYLVEPWQEISPDRVKECSSEFKIAPKVECSVCFAKRLLLASLAPTSSLVPFFVSGGRRIIETLRACPEFAREVENIPSTEVLKYEPQDTEIQTWARSFIRMVAAAQRDAWRYELYRRQQPTMWDRDPLRSIAADSRKKAEINRLLSDAHEESLALLQTHGDAILVGRKPVKRFRGRPSRPALKAVLRRLVLEKTHERIQHKRQAMKLRVLMEVLPVVICVCADLREEYDKDPAALAKRLRQYL